MPRGLDPTMAAELAKGNVRPMFLGELTLASGVERVWTGVGPITWNGKTFSGLGELVSVGPITESSGVQADGTTVSLNVMPSQIAVPAYPATPPTPPRATAPGENVAWAFATSSSKTQELRDGSGVIYATAIASLTTGSISFVHGSPLGANTLVNAWSAFRMPLPIPAGSRITSVYAVVVSDAGSANSDLNVTGGSYSGFRFGPGGSGGTFVGPDMGTIAGVVVTQLLQQTLASAGAEFDVSFVGLAVYYEGTPVTNTSLLYEAMSDVRVGAAAKIWFGFLSAAGAIVGQPFLAFSGMVDEPDVKDDPEGTKIVLALENRLRNLQRASQRRYTAADQKLDYRNDSGLNFVEMLQEISLVWGS